MNLDDLEFKSLNIELLNNLKYTNYGQIRESSSIDMSPTNRLAICTDKCVLILNQNFEWPSQLNNSSPFKFFLNQKSQNDKNKQQIPIDEWIQDLNESKNDAFLINVIRSVPKSDKFLNIFKKFHSLNEYKNSKPKSFQKQLQFMSSRSNANDKDMIGKHFQEPTINGLKERNCDEFWHHKALLDLTRLLDLDFYQFLSFLNPYSSGAAQENDLQNAFKFCKWNLNPKINLLFTLTEYNQMIIFDCTKFNSTNNSLKENQNSNYLKVFDTKSNSKMVNLTDYFITNHHVKLTNQKFDNIDDFVTFLSKIIPKVVSWSSQIYTQDGLEYEKLLIGFKSNHLAIFHIFSNLNVELVNLIDLSDMIGSVFDDEMVDTSLDGKFSVQIRDICLGKNEFLAIALSDGRLMVKNNSDEKFTFLDTKLIGPAKKINFDYINEQNFVLLAQTEYEIGFFLINNFKEKSQLIYKLDETKYSSYAQKPVKNYLTQGLFKLIDLKLIKNMSFLLVFENGLIDLVQLSISNSILSTKNTILNTNLNLNFGPVVNTSQDIFKTIKQLFLNRNNFVLYQINDFGKSSLIQKRPANFEINVYKVKNLSREILNKFFITSNLDTCPKGLGDFIWLLKNDLYFNNKVFMSENFDVIYENFKNYRALMNDKKDKLVYLKRVRILAYLMRNYFEAVANFDSYNARIGLDVDETSEESDYRDEDEVETESKTSVKKDADNSMVKSVSFYDLVFRETSLLIFKYHATDFVRQGFGKETNKLDTYEKVLLVQMADFCSRKNFFPKDEFKKFEGWLEKFKEEIDNKALTKVCDLCGRKFSSDGNSNLNKIKCISGHNMNRCEKTLMPLDNFKFKKCSMCNSKWNYLEIENGFAKNFDNILLNQVNYCLYCD